MQRVPEDGPVRSKTALDRNVDRDHVAADASGRGGLVRVLAILQFSGVVVVQPLPGTALLAERPLPAKNVSGAHRARRFRAEVKDAVRLPALVADRERLEPGHPDIAGLAERNRARWAAPPVSSSRAASPGSACSALKLREVEMRLVGAGAPPASSEATARHRSGSSTGFLGTAFEIVPPDALGPATWRTSNTCAPWC